MDSLRPDVDWLPETVPARMVNQYGYCPRLFHLEWVQSIFTSSDDVEEGLRLHRVVDEERGDLEGLQELQKGRRATSIALSSRRLGLAARLDVVEPDGAGGLIPVDYKKGSPAPDGSAWSNDRLQSLVQALLLQENGYDVDSAEIWYAETRQRVVIPVSDEAIDEVTGVLRGLWDVAASPDAPPPLVNSPRCPKCSLVGICMPDEYHALGSIGDGSPRKPPRRILAPRPDERPLYLTSQGATVGVRGGRLTVTPVDGERTSFRLIDISQVCIFGNVAVTAQATRELMSRDISILWFSFAGWFAGMTTGLDGKNVGLRISQFQAEDPKRLQAARMMIAGKIRNSFTQLRRNAKSDATTALTQLKALSQSSKAALSVGSLLGMEGAAARAYFSCFTAMLSPKAPRDFGAFDENGRSRRPPPDPLNALLSFCYALLVKDLTVVCHSMGLDPYYGVLHSPRFGRPALALDLAEEFRPLVADSVALQVVNNGEVSSPDFLTRAGACQLSPEGRKSVLRAYERRLGQEIIHPQFGYRVTYRRAMEVQARIFAAYLLGELPDYTPFVTR